MEEQETTLDALNGDGAVRGRQALRNAIWKSDYTRTRRDRILMTRLRAARLLHASGLVAGHYPQDVYFIIFAIPTRRASFSH